MQSHVNVVEQFSKGIQLNYLKFIKARPSRPDCVTWYNTINTICKFDSKLNIHLEYNIEFS